MRPRAGRAKRRIIGIAIVLALAAPGGIARADAVDDAKAGIEAQQRGDVDEAIRLYSKALAYGGLSTRSRAIVHNNRGLLYDEKGDKARAIADYNAALSADPEYPFTYYNRGSVYYHDGQIERAIEDFDIAIHYKPDYAQAFVSRGNAYRYKGDNERALADFDQAIRIKLDFKLAYTNRGVVRFALGQYPGAVADFQSSLKLFPADGYAVAWLHLAHVKVGQQDGDELARNYARLDRNVWPAAAIAYFLNQALSEEVRAQASQAQQQSDMSQSCEAPFYLGEDALQRGEIAAARALLRETVQACNPRFWERTGAAAELKRLSQ